MKIEIKMPQNLYFDTNAHRDDTYIRIATKPLNPKNPYFSPLCVDGPLDFWILVDVAYVSVFIFQIEN